MGNDVHNVRQGRPIRETKANSPRTSGSQIIFSNSVSIAQSKAPNWQYRDTQLVKSVPSLGLSELDNSETQTFRECFKSQIQNNVHQPSAELKRHQELVEKRSIHSLRSMEKKSTIGNFIESDEDTTSCNVPLKRHQQLIEKEPNFSVICVDDSDIEGQFLESDDDSTSSFIYYWTQCWSPYTSHKSLAHLLSACFSFVIEGEVTDISALILGYIGGCPCHLREGIFTYNSFSCFHCRPRCTCSSPHSSGCDICRLREVDRCFSCHQRYVKVHQCYPHRRPFQFF